MTGKNLYAMFAVTRDHRIVREYISPYWGGIVSINQVYRAYRVPYAWIPQLDPPREKPVVRVDVRDFRMPNAAPRGADRTVEVAGCRPFFGGSGVCVVTNVEQGEGKQHDAPLPEREAQCATPERNTI
jgi:hypothetical protein